MHPVFKTNRKGFRPTCAYLYEDGHVVVMFTRSGSVYETFVQIAESLGFKSISFGRDGEPKTPIRVVFHDPALLAAISCMPGVSIEAKPARLCHGSEKSRGLGIPVGSLSVYTDIGPFFLSDLTELISGPAYVQDNFVGKPLHEETWDQVKDRTYYGDSDEPIVKRFPSMKTVQV